MVFQPTAVRQMSHGGMQVETSFPLQLDSLHEFRLTLGERSVVVKGRVAHSRISDVDQDIITYRTGIEFIELSDRVADAIAPSSMSSRRNEATVDELGSARLDVQVFEVVARGDALRAAERRVVEVGPRLLGAAVVERHLGQHARVQAALRFVRPVALDLVERGEHRRRCRVVS